MDFELDDMQKASIEMAHDFAVNELRTIAEECDQKGEFPKDTLVPKACEAELTIGEVPEDYDGGGLDHLTSAMVAEELFWGDAGLAISLLANNLAITPIVIAGTDEQKEKWLPQLAEGKLACFCLTEPSAGSDAATIKTTAKDEGDHFVINGQKCFITNGGISDINVVFANADADMGYRGQTCFIVGGDYAGVSMGKVEDKMGIRASHTAEIFFDNVKVPKEDMLGGIGQGFYIAMKTFDKTRPGIAAGSVGLARAAFEDALDYAKERIQFGEPIIKNQAISFMLSEMLMKIEAGRSLYYKACWLADEGKTSSIASSSAKAYCAQMCMEVTTAAVQVLGGYGFMKDYPLERYMRDAKVMAIYEGTTEVQMRVLSANLMRMKELRQY